MWLASRLSCDNFIFFLVLTKIYSKFGTKDLEIPNQSMNLSNIPIKNISRF